MRGPTDRAPGKLRVEIPRFAGLPHCAAERIQVSRLFQLAELGLPRPDLFVMTSDRPPRLVGLASKLGELLAQPRMIAGSSARSLSDSA